MENFFHNLQEVCYHLSVTQNAVFCGPFFYSCGGHARQTKDSRRVCDMEGAERTRLTLLYGTGNEAKLSSMRSRLEKTGIELIGLDELKAAGRVIPDVAETGTTPLENAKLKAHAYYNAFRMPVFSCDSGLYFDNVPDEVQPGVHVRNRNGKCLSDEEMLAYYAGLAAEYGPLEARYRNAICLVVDEAHVYEAMTPELESEKFLIVDKPCGAIRKKGFPLDCLSIDIRTGKYYYDCQADELEQLAVEDGFLLFFEALRSNLMTGEGKTDSRV